jgi:hypothetical protein
MTRVLSLSLLVLALGGGIRVHGQAAVPPPTPPASELASLVDRYTVDRQAISRRYPVEYSTERYTRLTTFYRDWQKELAALPFEPLGVEGRIDHVLLTSRVDYELRLLAREQKWVEQAASLLPFAPKIAALLESRNRLDPVKPDQAAATLEEIARAAETAMKTLNQPRKPGQAVGTPAGGVVADAERARKINALRAVEVLNSLKNGLAEWNRFYTGYDPLFTWWNENSFARADKALAAYLKSLRENVIGYRDGEDEPIVGNPVGRDALVADLASEFVPYTPEDLLALARREFECCARLGRGVSATTGRRRSRRSRRCTSSPASRWNWSGCWPARPKSMSRAAI